MREPAVTVSETPLKISWTPCDTETSTSVIEDMDLLTKGTGTPEGAQESWFRQLVRHRTAPRRRSHCSALPRLNPTLGDSWGGVARPEPGRGNPGLSNDEPNGRSKE